MNVGVECDEAYHLGDWQRMSDKAREEEISARLNAVDGAGYKACHVRAYGTFEQMEHDIDAAVKEINRRKRKLNPDLWMPGVPPWKTAIERGSISVGDGLAFHSIADVCRCFGRDPKRMQKCFISLKCSIDEIDVSALDGRTVMALFMAVVSRERFFVGLLLWLCESGCARRWLERLKELDEPRRARGKHRQRRPFQPHGREKKESNNG